MSGECMSKEFLLDRIDTVVKELRRLSDELFRNGTNEAWACGIGAQLLQEYRASLVGVAEVIEQAEQEPAPVIRGFFSIEKFAADQGVALTQAKELHGVWALECDGKPVDERGNVIGTHFGSQPEWEVPEIFTSPAEQEAANG